MYESLRDHKSTVDPMRIISIALDLYEKREPEAPVLHPKVQRLARRTEQKVKSVQAHRCYDRLSQ